MIKFNVIVLDQRLGLVKTEILRVVEDRFVPSGYRGNEYVRHSGVQVGYTEVLGVVDGFLSYAEEREFEELLG